jgi:hypothetical protein
MANCWFCGIGTQTKEDALPRWVWAHLDVRGDVEIRRGSDGSVVRTMTRPDLRVGAPCRDCNNGWMSDLEIAFKGVGGGRLLAGDVPVALGPGELRVIARWIVKTTLMLHAASAHHAGDVAVPRTHFEAVRTATAVEGTSVFIAGVNAAGRDISFIRPIQIDRGGQPVAYVMAMSIGYLLTVVAAPIALGTTWMAPIPATLSAHFDRVWPLPDSTIQWPRTRDLTVNGFDEAWRQITWRDAIPVGAGDP